MDGKKKTNASAHCVWIVAYANLNTTDFLKLVSSLAFFFYFLTPFCMKTLIVRCYKKHCLTLAQSFSVLLPMAAVTLLLIKA